MKYKFEDYMNNVVAPWAIKIVMAAHIFVVHDLLWSFWKQRGEEMKELFKDIVEFGFMTLCRVIGCMLVIYLIVFASHTTIMLDRYLSKYSHFREVSTCQVLI